MGAILAGTMRSPFTGIVFAIELTHDIDMVLPLIVAAVIAHMFTVLVLKRSILTEKVARRGLHLSREYSVDPLEVLFVREVMRTRLIAFDGGGTIGEARSLLKDGHPSRGQHLYPVIDADSRLTGVITRKDLATYDGETDAGVRRGARQARGCSCRRAAAGRDSSHGGDGPHTNAGGGQ